jgi:GTP cyclohydrolase II
MTHAKDCARAIDALRRGWPVCVQDATHTLALLAIETCDDARLQAFDPQGQADILLSGYRAATLHLDIGQDASGAQPVRVVRPAAKAKGATQSQTLPFALTLADPAYAHTGTHTPPMHTSPLLSPTLALAALDVARLAGLLPAYFMLEDRVPEGAQCLAPESIEAYQDPQRLAIVTRARLPIAQDEAAEIVGFRSPEMAHEHIALIIGTPEVHLTPLVRLHSECLTGDVLGSLKCDCGPQLDAALERMAAHGYGILLYLRQEGRGIGLINKLRAYQLQDQGYDTMDANTRLGFAPDARDFSIAAHMLKLLGVNALQLLTNNPEKASRLESQGISVERVPHRLPPNPHNARYLATKKAQSGHDL